MQLWPFHRRQAKDITEEVQDYYRTEKQERVGVAGLLALGTLLVTLVLAVALYFGGRWVYRTVFDKDNDIPETAQQDEPEPVQEDPEITVTEELDENTSSVQVTPPSSTANPTVSPEEQGKVTDLPRTGPSDSMLLFFSTVLLATIWHYNTKSKNLGN